MPIAKLQTYTNLGVDALPVDIEVHISAGLPAFNIVGMAETAVKESRERVRSAILNSKFEFPSRRITVNLAPADLPKQGGGFDLAIAIGVLVATEQLSTNSIDQYCYSAELSLTGDLRPVKGILPIAIRAADCNAKLICAEGNIHDLQLLNKGKIYSAKSLIDVCTHLLNLSPLPLIKNNTDTHQPTSRKEYNNLNQIIGQLEAKKALEIAAAGKHNLLFVGPPGSGKSMLAKCITSILPLLSDKESLESAIIFSVCGKHRIDHNSSVIRSPHHTASSASLVGGGSPPVPGEISLAHKGVLFLDELPEFSPKVLQGLREPLENGEITISRAGHQSCFPAEFQLLTAMNPCPCGFYGSNRCDCSAERISRYQRRISGPFLDRIDMQVQMELPDSSSLVKNNLHNEESSETVRQRVERARRLQIERQGKLNSKLTSSELKQYAPLDSEAEQLLIQVMDKLGLSGRGLHKVLRVALTIADLEQEQFRTRHIKQALNFREQKLLK